MNITIVGTGYVGLVTGACFSEMGNKVYSVDIDVGKIEGLKNGIMPIYEHDLENMVVRNYEKGNIIFTTNLEEGLSDSNVCFIAAGTPMDEDGSADLSAVFQIAKNIGQLMGNDLIVVNKSTVPVGTGDKVRDIISKELKSRGKSFNFDVVSNPEFLKEGVAVKDAMRPDRVVIGSSNENSIKVLKELYSPYVRNHDRFMVMDIRSAEMSKYASNAMLATRISFMNEMANICEKVGADINNVRLGVGSDPRIGYSFLYAGCGYGGSCFPKDIQALIKTAEDNGYSPKILKEVEAVNKKQKMLLVNKIINRFGKDLSNLKIGIWGLSFKPGTDDMREAPSIIIINELLKRGATIKAYDPKAVEEAKSIFGDKIEFCDKKYDVLNDASCLVIVTEWNEFKSPNFEALKDRMKEKIIFDGRNLYTCNLEDKFGFEYYSIG
ncbi:MAG: UDP-glucose dehydrogenase family protein [Methanobacteriaceae archaeon]